MIVFLILKNVRKNSDCQRRFTAVLFNMTDQWDCIWYCNFAHEELPSRSCAVSIIVPSSCSSTVASLYSVYVSVWVILSAAMQTYWSQAQTAQL